MGTLKILCVVGTRPEAIKLAPVIKRLKEQHKICSNVVSTAQHREMLDQVLRIFGIRPDIDLNIMDSNQTLSRITSKALEGIEKVIEEISPDILLVQGDTTSVFAASLAAFYKRVPVGHIEAGLRSYDKFNPYPEEINRKLTSMLTELHFAPTKLAKENLLREGVPEDKIFVTGNTVIDALFMVIKSDYKFGVDELNQIDYEREKVILVTSHRRENWGKPLKDICLALKDTVSKYDNIHVVYPVHLNPNVQRTVRKYLSDTPRVHLIQPLKYPSFVNLMKRSYIILTDSGGVQEEAPSLGKPVLVLRQVTERPEASEAGIAKVIGTDRNRIVQEVSTLMEDRTAYDRMSKVLNPYGDGKAAERIVNIILEYFGA